MKYLVRKREGGRAHLIDKNGDTLCAMRSTGHQLDPAQYEEIEADSPPKPLCFMCEGRHRRILHVASLRRSAQLR
jgi:hypothetical protein